MEEQRRILDTGQPGVRRLTAEYVTARALLEATTIDEAAPRILEAICEALGWEHGALWSVDREAGAVKARAFRRTDQTRHPRADESAGP